MEPKIILKFREKFPFYEHCNTLNKIKNHDLNKTIILIDV